jgi:drug/metabolite transporter (DMT)-like permease
MASNVLVWKKLFNDHHLLPLHMTWLSFLVATPTMLMVLIFEFMLYPTNFPHVGESWQAVPDMLGLIYAITVAYTINYTVMAWCIRHSAVTIVSVSSYLDICEREACFYLHYQHTNT